MCEERLQVGVSGGEVGGGRAAMGNVGRCLSWWCGFPPLQLSTSFIDGISMYFNVTTVPVEHTGLHFMPDFLVCTSAARFPCDERTSCCCRRAWYICP